MHDPLTVAFDIPRPWPRPDSWHTKHAQRTGRRWKIQGCNWTVAGRGFYWPTLITIWHHDPSDYDNSVCSIHHSNAWKYHVHHWRIQVHPIQHFRRWLLTRCEVCGGKSRRGNVVNCSSQWDRKRGPWWRGERGLAHMDCRGLKVAEEPTERTA